LSHIFKEQTGYSPIKYASQLKIGEAQSLLMNTDRSVGSISEELGFGDNCHFNVMFKKYTNLSPTEYRRHFRKAQQENT
jgi:transcriptional regulator GlxA family with amidase domain